jgi:hypothetical protein
VLPHERERRHEVPREVERPALSRATERQRVRRRGEELLRRVHRRRVRGVAGAVLVKDDGRR